MQTWPTLAVIRVEKSLRHVAMVEENLDLNKLGQKKHGGQVD